MKLRRAIFLLMSRHVEIIEMLVFIFKDRNKYCIILEHENKSRDAREIENSLSFYLYDYFNGAGSLFPPLSFPKITDFLQKETGRQCETCKINIL